VQVRLSEEELNRVDRLAQLYGVSRAAAIRQCLYPDVLVDLSQEVPSVLMMGDGDSYEVRPDPQALIEGALADWCVREMRHGRGGGPPPLPQIEEARSSANASRLLIGLYIAWRRACMRKPGYYFSEMTHAGNLCSYVWKGNDMPATARKALNEQERFEKLHEIHERLEELAYDEDVIRRDTIESFKAALDKLVEEE